MTKEQKLQKIEKLYNLYKSGKLGGDVMPEDSNPHLDIDSKENAKVLAEKRLKNKEITKEISPFFKYSFISSVAL